MKFCVYWYLSRFFSQKFFWVILALFANFEAKCAKKLKKSKNVFCKCVLDFIFCTHQRVCILHFLKKSQIRCTLLYRDYATGLYLSEAQNPTPTLHTVYVYQYTYSVFTQGWVEGGDFNPREGERGQQFTKRVKNTNTTDCISSL